jgi:hypothetical protein
MRLDNFCFGQPKKLEIDQTIVGCREIMYQLWGNHVQGVPA